MVVVVVVQDSNPGASGSALLRELILPHPPHILTGRILSLSLQLFVTCNAVKDSNVLFAQAARAISPMSVAEFAAQDPAWTATDLLTCNKTQLVRYLESNAEVDGGFDISSLVGLERLSKCERIELAQRLW